MGLRIGQPFSTHNIARRLGIATLVAVLLIAGSVRVARQQTTQNQPYLVLIVMDGFRADYTTLAPMKHLHSLMARGMTYDQAWVGHIESTTPAGHATIATGVYPRKHEVIGFGWRWPGTNQFTFMPTDTREIVNGDIHKTMTQDGVPTISDLIHQQNQHATVVAVSAEKYYAAGTMGAGADYIMAGHEPAKGGYQAISVGAQVPPASTNFQTVTASDSTFDLQDGFAARLAARMATTLHPRALLVNLPAPDIAGHYYGGMVQPGQMAPIIKGTDGAIGIILDAYRKMGLLNRTIFLVTADHGMVGNRQVVPIHAMYKFMAHTLNLKPVEQEYPSSIGSIWLQQPANPGSVAAAMMAQHFNGIEGAFYRSNSSPDAPFVAEAKTAATLPANVLKADLDLANTEAGITGADILLAYREDATGLYVKSRKHWGSHGGFSWGSQHIPLIIAGPGVKHGVSQFPAKLVDVAPTLERLLSLPIPSGVDGVVLSDALTNSVDAERSAQSAVEAGRLADVKALEQHSLAEGGKK